MAPSGPASAGQGRSRRSRHGKLARNLSIFAISLLCVVLLTVLRAVDPLPVRNARETSFDLLQRLSPRAYADAPVRIVDIDEASLRALGQWPWPRHMLGELVDRLHAAGAATVAFDVIFAEADRLSPNRLAADPRLSAVLGGAGPLPDNDRVFADAMARGAVVIGFGSAADPGPPPPVKAGFAYTGEDPAGYALPLGGAAPVLPALAEAAAGIGAVLLSHDVSSSVVRRTPMLWSDGEQLYPSLAAEALRVAQGAQTYVVHADPRTGGVQSLRIGAFEVPTEPTGELNMHFTPHRDDRYVSAADIFDDDKLRALVPRIEGRIILVGTSATGLFDIRKTTLGENVPGVEIHAQAIEQIVGGQFLYRHDWTRGLEILALVIAALIISATTLFSGARLALFFGGVVAGLICLGAWDALGRYQVLLDPSFPLAGGLAIWFVATSFRYLTSDRERRVIRGAFSHYVHPTVLREIERSHRELRLGGENCELTVLFTDVRDFTQLSERIAPEEVVTFLNKLLDRLGTEIAREAGVIDKFIGDSVMAFWNAPLRQEDHARRACAAALKMRAAVAEMNAGAGFGLPEIVAKTHTVEIGIGINTGPACVGNVGSAERFDYSAIGDAVNVAARAESASKEVGYDIVVAESTAADTPDLAFVEAGRVALKGKAEPVALKILIGGAEVKASDAFAEFDARFGKMITALAEGDRDLGDRAMADCRGLAVVLDPKLLRFLDRVPQRIGDFQVGRRPRIGLVAERGNSTMPRP